MPRLTVLIPCKNEQQQIRGCIESVRGLADEILVADSGSTDATLSIVRQLGGCRVIEREFISYSSFKNWAIPQASNDWVLGLDADERVTPELAAEIRRLLATPPVHDCYQVQFRPFLCGRPIHYSGFATPFVKRLFRRDLCRFAECRVHESLEVPSGRVGSLKNRIDHYTASDVEMFVSKQNRYSSAAARDWYERGYRTNFLKLLFKGPLRFLQHYLLKGGILDGGAGLIVCAVMAYYSFLKEAKVWSLTHALPPAPGQESNEAHDQESPAASHVLPIRRAV